MSIKGEFWAVPERGGIWKAEIEGGLDGRMGHLDAATFDEMHAKIGEEVRRRMPQPKPVVERLPEPAVEVLPDDFHLPIEPYKSAEHFTEARPFEPVDRPVTITESGDDIQQHVALPPDAAVVPVVETPKRRGRPPRAA